MGCELRTVCLLEFGAAFALIFPVIGFLVKAGAGSASGALDGHGPTISTSSKNRLQVVTHPLATACV